MISISFVTSRYTLRAPALQMAREINHDRNIIRFTPLDCFESICLLVIIVLNQFGRQICLPCAGNLCDLITGVQLWIAVSCLWCDWTFLLQDPVLFSGTLRFNLDPSESFTDVEIWRALEYAHLKTFIESLSDTIYHECGEDGKNLRYNWLFSALVLSFFWRSPLVKIFQHLADYSSGNMVVYLRPYDVCKQITVTNLHV